MQKVLWFSSSDIRVGCVNPVNPAALRDLQQPYAHLVTQLCMKINHSLNPVSFYLR